jgi:hypothetical protein
VKLNDRGNTDPASAISIPSMETEVVSVQVTPIGVHCGRRSILRWAGWVGGTYLQTVRTFTVTVPYNIVLCTVAGYVWPLCDCERKSHCTICSVAPWPQIVVLLDAGCLQLREHALSMVQPFPQELSHLSSHSLDRLRPSEPSSTQNKV